MKLLIPQPISIQSSEWENIDYYIPNYFTKGFCHQYPWTMKLNIISRQATLIQLKRSYFASKHIDKIKLWMPISKLNGNLYFLYKNDKIKFHYEHNLINVWNKPFCLYGSINASKNGRYQNLKLGCDYFGGLYRLNNHIKVDSQNNIILYTRFLSYFKDIKIGGQIVNDIKKQNTLKKDIFMWYAIQNNTFQFKINQDWGYQQGFMGRIFNRFTTTVIHKTDNNLFGIEVELCRKPNSISKLITGLFEVNVSNKAKLKVKINDRLIGTLAFKFRPSQNIQISIGGNVPLWTKRERIQKYKIGGKIELNV